MTWVSKIQEAIDFIESNLFEPINAEAVGKAINYAPSSFSNFFSAVVGYSVGEYIRFRRLTIAAEQLRTDKISVTDAAFKCGMKRLNPFQKLSSVYLAAPLLKLSNSSLKNSLL